MKLIGKKNLFKKTVFFLSLTTKQKFLPCFRVNVAPPVTAGNPVNDAPSFVAGADQTVPENSAPQTVVGWATAISAGAVGQVTTFNVSNDNNGLFSTQPSIDPATGTLTYTPAASATGSASNTTADAAPCERPNVGP